jgi:phosphoserine phosphatase RsbU/P
MGSPLHKPPSPHPAEVIIVDDDRINLRRVRAVLKTEKFIVHEYERAKDALALLKDRTIPRLAVLDWEMPDMTGIELCRLALADGSPGLYIILLTGRSNKRDIVEGLAAGADDFVTKPFQSAELLARVKVGFRTLNLQERLVEYAHKQEHLLAENRGLKEFLPSCARCKRIEDDETGKWLPLQDYIQRRTKSSFSHTFCPDCLPGEFKV